MRQVLQVTQDQLDQQVRHQLSLAQQVQQVRLVQQVLQVRREVRAQLVLLVRQARLEIQEIKV